MTSITTAVSRNRKPVAYARKVFLAQTAFFAIALVVAEIVARIGNNPELLPSPSIIALNIGSVIADPAIQAALFTLLSQLVIAFLLSIIIGTVLGYLVTSRTRVENLTMPVVLLIYSIPQITLLPLFILYFGLGWGSKIAFGVSHGMFPIALGTIAGIHHGRANPIFLRWSMTLGATRWQRLKKVEFPQAVSALCVSMRLSMATTLLGVLLADIYASTFGVGYYTRLFTDTLQGPKLFGLVFLLALMAIIINRAVLALERFTSKWKY
jgi:ABC-type nitrate/sulfonate/bicarbonate transport system permease component